MNGCPDSDDYRVTDNKDLCPEQKELFQFNGCPDNDNYGVPSPIDECPETRIKT